MAGLMQASFRRGQKIDLETAYARAARANGVEPGRRPPAPGVGRTVVARARQATTPQTRSVAARPADPENDDREPAEIMRELLASAR